MTTWIANRFCYENNIFIIFLLSNSFKTIANMILQRNFFKSRLKKTLHGVIYQLKLLMLFAQRESKNNFDFELATEVEEAEKFDDVVFHIKNMNKKTEGSENKSHHIYLMLQAKHKQDEKIKIKMADLFPESYDKKKEGDFSLYKYLNSFHKIKQKEDYKDATTHFFICTNIGFDDALKESVEPVTEKVVYENFFEIKNEKNESLLYKFKKEFYHRKDLMKKLKDFTIEDLVENLVKKLFGET
jgi:hypothetical protein